VGEGQKGLAPLVAVPSITGLKSIPYQWKNKNGTLNDLEFLKSE